MGPRTGDCVVVGRGPLARRIAELALPGVWCVSALPTAAAEAEAQISRDLTEQALRVASESGRTLHLISSLAVGGAMSGSLHEKHFDEGQDLDTVTSRATFEQERLVRAECKGPWRIYRTAWVIDGSDGIDGPIHFFRALEMTALMLPSAWTLYGPDFGRTDVVPLAFVIDALTALASIDGLDGQTFHLGSGAGLRTADVHNVFAALCSAPRAEVLELATGEGRLAQQIYRGFMDSPRWARQRAWLFRELGIPVEAILRLAFDFDFDCSETATLLAERGVTCPALEDYAPTIWARWQRELRPLAWSA